ncbi:MAG: DUF1080 domain-containing protein [Pirellulales bacterium]
MLRLAALALCLASSLALPAGADEAGYTTELFNGKDTTGWVVTGTTVDVVDGALRTKENDGFVRSALPYDDFVLELDWKASDQEKYDSGIYIRCDAPAPDSKRVWPAKYQINLKNGDEGNLLGVKTGGKSTGLIKKGDWNHFKVTVVGNSAEMEINGKPAWKAEGLDVPRGYIGLQSEVPLGGQFLFKNIKVTELGFTSLFNGKDLSQWTPKETGYAVHDGIIEFDPKLKKGGNLYSEKEYEDFALRFDFKLEPGTNNGLGIRTPTKGDAAYVGMELQILDDVHPKYKGIAPYQSHGSVYGIAPAKRGFLKPAGEWNTQEVIAKGRHITITLNGTVIQDVDLDQAAPEGKTLDHKEHPGMNNSSGHIGFLGHGDPVAFRAIRIKNLKPTP